MSLRLRLLRAGLRAVAKPLFGITRHAGAARWGLVLASLALPLPLGVSARRGGANPVRLRLAPALCRGHLVWFHGGAYVAGSAFTHRGLLGRIARAAGIEVIAPDYRLAPEHPAPAAFEDGLAAIRALGLPPGVLVLGGDSAGGGLAAALAARLCAEGTPPRGLILLSPWADLTLQGESIRSNARRDPLIPAAAMGLAVSQIRGDLAPDDPRLSPVFADWKTPPPCLLQVGSTEVLRDESLALAARLVAAGGVVTLERLAGAPHVLAFFAPWVPEATAAIARIAGFIRALPA